MSGGNEGYGSRGVAPRAIQHVFHEIAQAEANVAVTVRVSYLEIYNETLYDLLTLGADSGEPAAPALAIRERRDGSTYVRGLACPVARTEQDALRLLFEGDVNRAVAEHQLNAASTRSHCIFTLHIERRCASPPSPSCRPLAAHRAPPCAPQLSRRRLGGRRLGGGGLQRGGPHFARARIPQSCTGTCCPRKAAPGGLGGQRAVAQDGVHGGHGPRSQTHQQVTVLP